MLKPILTLATLAAIPAGIALADDDDDRYRGSLKDVAPLTEVMRVAEENGWTLREIEMDDGYYELEARTREGREIEVKLHPVTLEIIGQEYDDDDDDDDDRGGTGTNPAPAGTVQPPQNGLFAPGATPQVQVK